MQNATARICGQRSSLVVCGIVSILVWGAAAMFPLSFLIGAIWGKAVGHDAIIGASPLVIVYFVDLFACDTVFSCMSRNLIKDAAVRGRTAVRGAHVLTAHDVLALDGNARSATTTVYYSGRRETSSHGGWPIPVVKHRTTTTVPVDLWEDRSAPLPPFPAHVTLLMLRSNFQYTFATETARDVGCDEKMAVSDSVFLPGLVNEAVASINPNAAVPFLFHSNVYMCLAVFGLAFPFRLWFYRITTPVDVVIWKRLHTPTSRLGSPPIAVCVCVCDQSCVSNSLHFLPSFPWRLWCFASRCTEMCLRLLLVFFFLLR